jgi:hypothetical protein
MAASKNAGSGADAGQVQADAVAALPAMQELPHSDPDT